MLQHIKYNEYLPQAMEQLPRGAFLTVKSGDLLNTMTIGWGTIGYIWEMPIFTVAVRYSRHTYELINQAGNSPSVFPWTSVSKKNWRYVGQSRDGTWTNSKKVASLLSQPKQWLPQSSSSVSCTMSAEQFTSRQWSLFSSAQR